MARVVKSTRGSGLTRLRGRSLLTLQDLTDAELLGLLELAARLKRKKQRRVPGRLLAGRQLVMIFEKSSTRTRCAASVAAADEGGRADYLSGREIHLGVKESVEDTARVLGRMYDGILFRGYAPETAELLARHAGVPVWNGLTDTEHPTQAIADLFTVRESFGRLRGLKLVFVGDARNNVACSLMVGCAKAGVHFACCAPEELEPSGAPLEQAREVAARNGSRVELERDPLRAVRGANVIYTDVWVSMGEESQKQRKTALLRPYQVTMDLLRATGNLERNRVIFLHCLPAFHDTATQYTRESGALEVADDVFESPYSRVFDLAENKMHTMKALFVAALAGKSGRSQGRTR